MDTSTNVLLLSSVYHGGLAITRTLGRLGVAVYVVAADTWAPAVFSKYCRGRFVWDFNRAPREHSLAFLAAIGRKLGRRAILIPTADTTALFVAAHADPLREWFLFPQVPFDLTHSLCSKKKMYFLARSVGVATPNTFFPASRQDVLAFAEEARFPIMLKAIEDRRAKNPAARKKVIVREKQQLLEHYTIMEDPRHPNLVLQEYIPGGEDASWMFNGYFGQNSECLFGLAGKKIRQYRPSVGITSLGVCQPNATVVETTKAFMKAIKYRGILDIGYRYDARDGLYKVFDVNPRIGCTFRLFVSDNGMDVARALYLDLTGQPVVAGHDLPGRKWMAEDIDLATSFYYWRDGKLTLREWLRSFQGLQESSFLAWDDLHPMLSICLCDFRHLFRRLRRQETTTPREDAFHWVKADG
jgi:D-aspartate ligase